MTERKEFISKTLQMISDLTDKQNLSFDSLFPSFFQQVANVLKSNEEDAREAVYILKKWFSSFGRVEKMEGEGWEVSEWGSVSVGKEIHKTFSSPLLHFSLFTSLYFFFPLFSLLSTLLPLLSPV